MSTLAAPVPPPSPLPAIDEYRPGDDTGIVACIRDAFGASATLERWRHLHLANPVGRSVIVVARQAGAIVGQIAGLQRRLRFFRDEHRISHTVDTAVHPTWQHRGVFPALVEASERAVERHHLRVTYGVANAVAERAAVRYEHRQPLGAFPVLVRPLRPLASLTAVARHHLSERSAAASRVTECAASGPVASPTGPTLLDVGAGDWRRPRFDARHTALFDDAADLPPIAFVRDAAVLAWRYPERPGLPYVQRDLLRGDTVVASAIVRLVESSGLRLALVMEWHWRQGADDAGRALAIDSLALARRAGAHAVAAMGARGSAQRRVLGGLGFVALPARAFPQSAWPGVYARAPHAGDARWTTPTNWYFTWGDGLTL